MKVNVRHDDSRSGVKSAKARACMSAMKGSRHRTVRVCSGAYAGFQDDADRWIAGIHVLNQNLNDVRETLPQFVEPRVAQEKHYERYRPQLYQRQQFRRMMLEKDGPVAAH